MEWVFISLATFTATATVLTITPGLDTAPLHSSDNHDRTLCPGLYE